MVEAVDGFSLLRLLPWALHWASSLSGPQLLRNCILKPFTVQSRINGREEGTSVPVCVRASATQQITTDILGTVCAEMFPSGLQKIP